MKEDFDLIIKDGLVLAPDPKTSELKTSTANIAIKNGIIVSLSPSSHATAAKEISARGLHVLPGVIDTQVHFRDPGFPQKEDIGSGSRAAVMGGVTAFFDMPNTSPPTLSGLELEYKMNRAREKSWCHYAFYIGASANNVDHLPELENLPGVCGVKVFMGSSTGNLVINNDSLLEKIVKNGKRRMAVHAEDETRLQQRKKIVLDNPGHVELHHEWRDVETALIATKKMIHLAKKFNRPVHILHVTSAEEMEILAQQDETITCEVTPQHLTLSAPECYVALGTLAQMNPPIREIRHQKALWQAINNNVVDVIGSDHAPHTLAEKEKQYPNTPSGMPGVQTSLPLLLDHFSHGRLSLEKLVQIMSANPAKIFAIKNKGQIREGFDADIVLVDLNKKSEIKNSWIQSPCGWSPFAGKTVQGWPIATIVRGNIVMREDEILGTPQGSPIEFFN